MTYKVYLAAEFFTPQQIAVVEEVENVIRHVYGFSLYSPRQDGIVLRDRSPEERKQLAPQVFKTNCDAIDAAHLLVAVVSKDAGTVWEMGYAYARMKVIIGYAPDTNGVNVMLAQCMVACARTPNELRNTLSNFRDNKRSFADWHIPVTT